MFLPGVCRHEAYESKTYCNDIAVLELEKDAEYGQPIGGLMKQQAHQPEVGLPEGFPLVGVGWGYTG